MTNGAYETVAELAALTVPPKITRANIDDLLDRRMIEVRMNSGAWLAIRRNGATKTWKSQPFRVRIPYKYGFRGYGAITTWDFVKPDGTHLNEEFVEAPWADACLDLTQYRVKPAL